MDYKVINKAIAVTENLFDGVDERPVDCDFVLPDYYPDIAAVLKCTLKPVIQSKQLSGDRLIVDGIVIIQVLYLDEARVCIRSCEITKPFTSTFNVKSGVENPCIRLTAKTEYVNCRAVSPRRLDVHGSFSVKLKVTAEASCDVVSAINGEKMFTRHNVVTYSVPAMSAEKSFSINEVLEIGANQPPAEVLIRGDAVPVLNDCRLMANKAIIKGELMLCNLYVSDAETGDTHKIMHEIPFSQIIDIEGLDEEWQCDVKLDVISSDVHIGSNQNGEGRLLEVNMKLAAGVQSYRTGMAEIVADAYSSCCPLRLETKRLDTRQLTAIHRDTSTLHESFDLPEEGAAQVIDMWCDAAVLSERCEQGKSHIAGRLMIYMLAKDGAGLVSFYERPSDFELEFEDDSTGVSADVVVCNAEYNTQGGGKVDISARLDVTRRCFSDDSMVAVADVLVDENAAFPSEKAALKIYFANSGESIWEVAKACHTSMDAVMEENTLDGDVLTKDTMLLVPLC
ncbi:MAG: DUF3794 domain-containing protein [Oscillospiraceae bacterium]|nr:DUF3794 domain-containing protein [Oscillospiraceae bacterium]